MFEGIVAVVYRSARALGFEPVLYLYCDVNDELPEAGPIEIVEFPLDLDCSPNNWSGTGLLCTFRGNI
jgi:hypothetical protein